MQHTSSSANVPQGDSSASPTASSFFLKVEKKDLLRYLGNRIRVQLDDGTTLIGRLVSVSVTGNIVLTDPERERPRKRRRGEDPATFKAGEVTRECYASVVFLRGNCIASVGYTSSLTAEKTVVTQINGTRDDRMSRTIELANASPSGRF